MKDLVKFRDSKTFTKVWRGQTNSDEKNDRSICWKRKTPAFVVQNARLNSFKHSRQRTQLRGDGRGASRAVCSTSCWTPHSSWCASASEPTAPAASVSACVWRDEADDAVDEDDVDEGVEGSAAWTAASTAPARCSRASRVAHVSSSVVLIAADAISISFCSSTI